MSSETEKTLYAAAERQTAFNEKLTSDLTVAINHLTASLDLNDRYREWLQNEAAEIAARLAREIEERIQQAFVEMLGGINGFADKMKEATALTINDFER